MPFSRLWLAVSMLLELRDVINFPSDLSTPEGMLEALTRLLALADKLAAMTPTNIDDQVVDFLEKYATDEKIVAALANFYAFLTGAEEDAQLNGRPFDIITAGQQRLHELAAAGEFGEEFVPNAA